ncbi:MAG: hypothetical protein ABSD68_02430 [Candidatus Micrarchaeales archaeon]|jgi:radical SAM superfamily enzyme YgiQ (UPF0313 family)
MQYYITVNKKYRYVKVYNVIRNINENSNRISKLVSSFVDRVFLKRKEPK